VVYQKDKHMYKSTKFTTQKILEVQMFKSVGMNVYDCLYLRVFVYI